MNLTTTFCLFARLRQALPMCSMNCSEKPPSSSSSNRSGGTRFLHARAPRVTFLEAHLADRLDAADFDALEIFLYEHFLLGDASLHFVVPHLDLDAPIQRPPLSRGVRCDRPRVASPFV